MEGGRRMKEYQDRIGRSIMAAAMIAAAFILAGAIENAGVNIQQGLRYAAEILR